MKLKLHQDIYISGVILLLIAGVFYLSLGFSGDSAVFPRMLAGGMTVLNLFILAGGIKKTREMNPELDKEAMVRFADVKMPLVVFGFIVIYAVLFNYLGYFIATPLFMLGLMCFYRFRKWKAIILLICFFHLFIWVLFVWQLKVQLLHW